MVEAGRAATTGAGAGAGKALAICPTVGPFQAGDSDQEGMGEETRRARGWPDAGRAGLGIGSLIDTGCGVPGCEAWPLGAAILGILP